jgi:hypothetical protein
MATKVSQFRKRVGRASRNGELLTLAETHFDVLITLDTNLRYQQNLAARRISIVVIRSRSNRLDDLRTHFSSCVSALETIKPGTSST